MLDRSGTAAEIEHNIPLAANLRVSNESERKIQKFFIDVMGIDRSIVKSGLHVTVYHARRYLLGLSDYEENVHIEINPMHLRFMVMAPGGENPRPDVDASASAIGVRLKRKTPEMVLIGALRSTFYQYETPSVLGTRRPSNHAKSAFGARHFQPHITLLKNGSGIDRDLTRLGEAFRTSISPIRLDRLVVRCRSKPSVTT